MKYYRLSALGICMSMLYCILAFSVIGQERISELPNIIPPSPHAAALGKFGDIPVSLYTGIPNISIPVYTAHAGSFSLPISLGYHSQGLKVEEVAGYVGLHWALSAGGVITRSVHTGADEGGLGYWSQGNKTNESIASSATEMEAFCNGVYDQEPDIFYFNFNGRSGKFMMDATPEHKAHIIPYQSLAITHDATLSQFQILDENGIKYIFAAKETTTDDNSPEAGIKYFTSAWYLSKIETPAGEITFAYSSEITHQQQISELQRIRATPDPQYCNFQGTPYLSVSYFEIYALILTEINTPTEKIIFNISGNRRDRPASYKVDSITVKDFNGSVKRSFELSYSYFGNLNSTSAEAVRLKLDGIREVSLNNEYKNYAFEYYDEQEVPALSSRDRDYWGFYNGKSNGTLLPYVDPLIWGRMAANQAGSFGNRDAVFLKGRVGTLKKITYPTGGSTELVYEGHDYGHIGGVGYLDEFTKVTGNAIAQAKISGSINIPTHTVSFSINTTQDVTLNYQGSYVGMPPVENGPTVFLKRVNNDGTRTTLYQRTMINTTDVEDKYLTAGNYEIGAIVDGSSQAATISLNFYSNSLPMIRTKQAGGIRIKKVINYDPVANVQNIKSYQYLTKDDASRSSGKLVNNIDLVYVQSTPGGCGRLIRSSHSNSYLGFTQGSHIGYSFVTETEEINNATNTTNGKKECYYTSSSDLPNTNYYSYHYGYNTTAPNLVTLTKHPKYLTDYDFARGLLTKEIFYDASGTKIKETINDYNTGDALVPGSPNYFEFFSRIGFIVPAYTVTTTEGHEKTVISLRLVQVKSIVPWIYKTVSVETLYGQPVTGNLTTTTNYFFDNPAHGQLTRTEVFDSKRQAVKTINKYAADKNQISGIDANAGAALDYMVLKNKIGPVIQQEHYRNNNLVSLSRTDYKVWDAAAKIIAPEKIWQQTFNNPIENSIVFNAYDPNENVLEVAKRDNIKQSYIWDYRNSKPAAEVLNASFSDIAYNSFESDGSGNWSGINTANVISNGGLTGSKYYNQSGFSISKPSLNSSTEYIVSYWTLNNYAYSIAGTQTNWPKKLASVTINGVTWNHFEHLVSGQSTITVNGSGSMDELRLYPKNAQMITYTYEPLVGITSQTDVNNRISYYEYDGFGRLKHIRDQDNNILKKYEYKYQ